MQFVKADARTWGRILALCQDVCINTAVEEFRCMPTKEQLEFIFFAEELAG